MSPSHLHKTAASIRERYSPPDPTMNPGIYVSHEAMHVLADALDRTADQIGDESTAAPQSADDAYMRHQALDAAVRAQRGPEDGAEIAARAEAFLVFMRGEQAPRKPSAPSVLHEAIDRAWASIETSNDGFSQTMSSADDEEVLELLRQLPDADLRQATFTIGIVRALGQSLRADLHGRA